jgi:hypothetical protein
MLAATTAILPSLMATSLTGIETERSNGSPSLCMVSPKTHRKSDGVENTA